MVKHNNPSLVLPVGHRYHCQVCGESWARCSVEVYLPHYICTSCRDKDPRITSGNSIEFDNADEYGDTRYTILEEVLDLARESTETDSFAFISTLEQSQKMEHARTLGNMSQEESFAWWQKLGDILTGREHRFYVQDGCNLVIDRQLNHSWIEIEADEVENFLDGKGLVWHKDLIQDEAVLIFREEALHDGKCKVLTSDLEDNLTEEERTLVVELPLGAK